MYSLDLPKLPSHRPRLEQKEKTLAEAKSCLVMLFAHQLPTYHIQDFFLNASSLLSLKSHPSSTPIKKNEG